MDFHSSVLLETRAAMRDLGSGVLVEVCAPVGYLDSRVLPCDEARLHLSRGPCVGMRLGMLKLPDMALRVARALAPLAGPCFWHGPGGTVLMLGMFGIYVLLSLQPVLGFALFLSLACILAFRGLRIPLLVGLEPLFVYLLHFAILFKRFAIIELLRSHSGAHSSRLGVLGELTLGAKAIDGRGNVGTEHFALLAKARRNVLGQPRIPIEH